MNKVIEVENLFHQFGAIRAVNDFNFSVEKGEVLALLGPNGAGKTTTVRLINGLFPPTSGQIRLMGLDPVSQGDQVRSRTGVLTETPALYERLTAWQNIAFFGVLYGMEETHWRERGEELLGFFGLEDRANDRVATFSKGMKQRLALARAMLNNPPVLFLDEPTSGLDPEAALQVHELILTIRKTQGQTVVLCTHNLVEAQRLCDRMAILHRGNILALGSLSDLRQMYSPGVHVEIELMEPPAENIYAQVGGLPGVVEVQQDSDGRFGVQVESRETIPGLVAHLVGQGERLLAVKPEEVTLEDIYFKLQNQARGGVQ